MPNYSTFKFISLFFLLSFVASFNLALADSLDKTALEQQTPLALEGYDVITYFDLAGAKSGVDAYQAIYRGKRYLFSSTENQQKFADDPQRYLPQYDGHCAQSMATEKVVLASPDIYVVDEGKLYMFSNEAARQEWSLEPQNNLVAANKNWHFNAEKREQQIKAKNLWKNQNRVTLFNF